MDNNQSSKDLFTQRCFFSAIPHYTTEEVEVEGYTIPANTVVTPNLFSIDRDPETWKHPFEFYPGHFLDENGAFYRPEAFLPFSAGI